MPAQICPQAFVDPTARIADGAVIMQGAWVGPRVQIGEGSVVEPNAVVGYHTTPDSAGTVIGRNCLIANNATIYHSVTLADGVKVRHNAVIRENVSIGAGTNIGCNVSVELNTRIGAGCSLHSQAIIADESEIGDLVFIGPGFLSMSDLFLDYKRPGLHRPYKGVTIGSGARIGGGVVAYPGAVIGVETAVGACSVVRGTLPDRMLCVGNPARPAKRVAREEQVVSPELSGAAHSSPPPP